MGEFLRNHPELQAMLQGLRDCWPSRTSVSPNSIAWMVRNCWTRSRARNLVSWPRQQAVRERTEALKNRLDQLSQFIPFLSPELRQHIGEAGEFMGEAQGQLGERRAHQAIPPEEEALRRLSQGQQAMQQAMQQMAQRGQMGQIPVPMVLRRPGDPFAFNREPFPDHSPQDQGRMGINTPRLQNPRQGRIEGSEAISRGDHGGSEARGTSQFKGQIEQYFKNLTE